MSLSIFHIAVSGMYANAAKLAVAAHNIANSATQGFKKQTAVIESSTPSGIQGTADFTPYIPTYIELSTEEGLPDADMSGQLSNVDIVQEYIAMKIGSYGYRANAAVIRTSDSMLGSILDIIV
ncbi:MAG: flagellar basal body protein [Desulfobacterota bacterium]|nr:flagellar basal body protein [Thermodesulfobacteriota bacterium]